MALRTKFGFAAVNHLYTDEEKQILQSYQSLEYLPPHSKVYRNWLQQQPARLDWDRWLMMGLIGFSGNFNFSEDAYTVLWAQSFTSLMADIHQDISRVSSFSWRLNGKFP